MGTASKEAIISSVPRIASTAASGRCGRLHFIFLLGFRSWLVSLSRYERTTMAFGCIGSISYLHTY